MLRSEGKQPSLTVRRASPQGASHEGGGGGTRAALTSAPPGRHNLTFPLCGTAGAHHGLLRVQYLPGAGGIGQNPPLMQGGEEGRAGGHSRGPLVAAPKPPKGAGVTAGGRRTPATLAIAQVPAMPGDRVLRGTPAPRATDGSPQPVGSPVCPMHPWALPGGAVFQLPPPASMAAPWPCQRREKDGSRGFSSLPAGPCAEQGGSRGPEATIALRVLGPAGRASARGHRRAMGCTGGFKALGVLRAPALLPVPLCLVMSQTCFGAEPCPVPPSSRDSPRTWMTGTASEHPRHSPGTSQPRAQH